MGDACLTYCDQIVDKKRSEVKMSNDQRDFVDRYINMGVFLVGFLNIEEVHHNIRPRMERQISEDRDMLVKLIKDANEPVYYETFVQKDGLCNIL